MPAGALVTVPPPAPALLRVSVLCSRSRRAVTVAAAVRVTVQEPVPEQPPPLQPVKVEPGAGAAVKIGRASCRERVEQLAAEVMPEGALVTVPPPAPALLTVSVLGCRAKLAVAGGGAVR